MDVLANFVDDEITKKNNTVTGDKTPVNKEQFQKDFDESLFINKEVGKRASQFSPASFDLGDTGLGQSQYDQNIPLSIVLDNNLNKVRADRQGFFDKLANTLVGGAGSGLITAAEGFTNVFDQLSNFVTSSEQFEKSALTTLLGEGKEGLLEAMPIYRRNPEKIFDLSDSGFYFELMRGVIDSAIGFSIPGMAYAGAVGKLGSILGRGELMGRRLDVLTRAYGGSNFAQNTGMLAASSLSNFNEGTVLALEVYDQEYERSRQALIDQTLGMESLQNESELSSEDIKKIEDTARKNASDAANNTRNLNMLMMGSNYFQLRGTLNLKNAIIGGQSSARNLVKKPSVKAFWMDQAKGAPIEALEEITQNVMSFESQFNAQKRLEDLGVILEDDQKTSMEDDLGKRLIEFATSDEALLEGLMGFISGPVQYGITRAPFNKGQKAAQNKRFASQQAIIGANEEFLRKDLTQQMKAEDLAGRFQEFRDKFQKSDNVDEAKMQEEYFQMIENSSFDILATKNFFTGTTEHLEEQLQSVGKDPNATAEEKTSAEKLLGRLSELEQRFNSFNRYEDGARIFAKTLRLERIEEIQNNLKESFPKLEAQTTKLINAKLDILSEVGFSYGDMGEHFWIEGKDSEGKTVKSPLRSIQEVVTAIQDPDTKNKIKMSKLMSDHNIFNSESITNFVLNRTNAKSLDRIKNQIEISLDEDKSLNGQDLFTRMNSVINSSSTDVASKIQQLEDLKKDKRFKKGKFDDLKRQIDNHIIKHKKVEKSIKEDTDQETKNKIQNTKTTAVAEKTAAKTTGAKTAQAKDAANDTVTINSNELFDADPSAFDDLDIDTSDKPKTTGKTPEQLAAEQTKKVQGSKEDGKDSSESTFVLGKKSVEGGIQENPEVEPGAESKPKEVTVQVGKTERTYTVDPDGTVRNKDGAVIKSQSIINKVSEQLTSQTEGVSEGTTEGIKPVDPKQAKIDELNAQKENEIKEKAPYVITRGGFEGDNNSIASITFKSNIDDTYAYKQENTFISDNALKGDDRLAHITDEQYEDALKAPDVIKEINDRYNRLIDQLDQTKEIVPVEQVKNKDNVKDEVLPEILPTSVEEKGSAKQIVDQISIGIVKAIEAPVKKEGGGSTGSPNVKLMTTHSNKSRDGRSQKFSSWLTNGKSKKGETMVLTLDLDPKFEQHFQNTNVQRAIMLVKQAKKMGKELNEEEKEHVNRWIPLKLSHSEDPSVFTYMYNFNEKAGPKQKDSEVQLKKAAVNSYLTGRPATVKIKDQAPGELIFDDNERMLSELPGALDNPQSVNLFYTVSGTVQPVSGTRNPFIDTVLTYQNADGTRDSWEGALIMEINTLSGHSFPLKLNVRKHDVQSATLVYEVYKDILEGKNLNNQIKTENPALYEKLIKLLPTLESVYPNLTYTQAINDLVYQSENEGYGRIGFKSGNLFIGDKVFGVIEGKNVEFRKSRMEANKDQIVSMIVERKGFNVNVKALNENMAYRKHVFSSYLSSNAVFENMFDISGRLNPDADHLERMKSGALYVDSTTTELAPKALIETETKPADPKPVDFSASLKESVLKEGGQVAKDNLEKEGKEVSEAKPKSTLLKDQESGDELADVGEVQVGEVESKIALGGLNGGFKTKDRNSFDPRSDNKIQESISKNESFITKTTKGGKNYIVAGLYLEGTESTTSGRDGYTFATIEDTGDLPANIGDILINKAKKNAKNVYPKISDNPTFAPIKSNDLLNQPQEINKLSGKDEFTFTIEQTKIIEHSKAIGHLNDRVNQLFMNLEKYTDDNDSSKHYFQTSLPLKYGGEVFEAGTRGEVIEMIENYQNEQRSIIKNTYKEEPKTLFDKLKDNIEQKNKVAEENNPCNTGGKKNFSSKFTGGKKL